MKVGGEGDRRGGLGDADAIQNLGRDEVDHASVRRELQGGRILGPVDPSFRALSGHLKFTVRRQRFNKDSLSLGFRGWGSRLGVCRSDAREVLGMRDWNRGRTTGLRTQKSSVGFCFRRPGVYKTKVELDL